MTSSSTGGAPVNPGDVLAGKYRVDRILGVGGMGVVVAATHLHLGQRVALKFLLPDLASRPDIVTRFGREARAAVKIQSEHVARVLDTGTLDTGAPYTVMEYLEGSDLSAVIQQRGPLDGQEAVEYVLQACEALAEAHVAGIVHRDLKPANLFLTRRADGSPCVKVLDFGISKATLMAEQGGGQPLTRTAAMMGSPKYMSPEQLRSSRDVDARTDIWALGMVFYELLTGETAFQAPTMPELCVAILQHPPLPLRARRPEAPPGVEAIILRCLEKDPARRFASVAELAVALGEFAPPRARISVDRVTRIIPTRTPPGGAGVLPATAVDQRPLSPGAPPPHGLQSGPGLVSRASPGAAYPPAPHLSGPPAGSYAHQGYAAPGPGYVPAPHDGRGYPGSGYGPPPQRTGALHPSTVVLIILAVLFALGSGSCVMCMCLGAAAQ